MPTSSYNPTRMQFRQMGGMHDGMNVVYPFRIELSKLPDIEDSICRLISEPGLGRQLGDDFEKRVFARTVLWVLKPGSRLVCLQKSVRTLREVKQTQFEGTGDEVQFGLYAYALLSVASQPEFQGLFEATQWKAFKEDDANKLHEQFNKLLNRLRDECKEPTFLRKVKSEKTEVQKRRSSLNAWFRAVIKSAQSVLWIQIQMSYENRRGVTDAATALQHRAKFLKCRRSAPEFKHMLGYVCKLHYLPARGYVHDLVVLYDADYVFESESTARALGELWLKVTDGSGVVFIGDGPGETSSLAVNGLVSFKTNEEKKKVKDTVEYLSQFDTYIHFNATDKSKTLVKSQASGARKKKN